MPISADIYNAFAPKVQSPQDVTNGLAHQALAGQALQSGQLELQQRQAALANAPAMAAQAAAEQQAKMKKLEAETALANSHAGEFEASAAVKKLQFQRDGTAYLAQKAKSLNSDEDIANWYSEGVKLKIVTPDEAMKKIEQVPPAGPEREKWKLEQFNNGMGAAEQRHQELVAAAQAESARHNKTGEAETSRNHRVNEGIAGGHLAVSRASEARQANQAGLALTKPFEVTGQDGTPMLVQQDKQGNISPVQGYGPKAGTAKPLTDAQAKALGYGTRMQESDKILTGLEGKYSPAAINTKIGASEVPVVGGLLGMIGNAGLSEGSQQAEQAQRDFINAVLRRESGAAISGSEFENARKQYFPQPNDKPGTLSQKAANRKLAMEGVLAEVPKGQRGSIGPQTETASAGGFDAAAIAAELKRRGH